jgi:lipopolysaccharide/colanic/teichoic acid biosynthesis glycosyltransferase
VILDVAYNTVPLDLVSDSSVLGRLGKAEDLYELLFKRVCSDRLKPDMVLFGGGLNPSRSSMALQAIYGNLLALMATIVLAPVMLLFAVLVRLSSPGGVCDVTLAAGWNLTPFTQLRFRCHRLVKTTAGERRELTRVGSWLKRLKLDGLPQLLNVLRGEMSLVGPRPIRAEFASALIDAFPYYRLRFTLKPGLFGWSQIHRDSEGDIVTALEYDLYYAKHISPSLDLSILSRAMTER